MAVVVENGMDEVVFWRMKQRRRRELHVCVARKETVS